MKFLVKSLLTILILAAAAGGYWYFYLRPTPAAVAATAGGPPQGMAMPVEAVQVKAGTINRRITAVGTLRSDESVMIRPEVAGRVTTVQFEEGKPAKKGQVLLQLDTAVARAELAEAKASLALSQANSERAEELYRRGSGSAQARDQAVAKLRADEAQVQLSQAKLDKMTLAAPMNGLLGLRRVSVGDYVNVGQDIVNLEAVDPIKVDFRVPEIFFPAVKVGQTIEVTIDALPGRTFSGAIYAIDPLIDPAGRSIVIRARLPNPDEALRPGTFARVTLVLPTDRPAVLVPEQALVPIGSDHFVYKVVDGKAQLAKVKIGERRDAVVEVVEGLSPGDTVVTAGQHKLRNGVPVQIAPQPGV
jgi:membrane fusion protein (multidrug efflux system)